jgi:hypothetical protein
MEDYLGAVPDHGFKHMFHVSCHNYESVRNKLCLLDPVFTDSFDA